MPDKRSLSTNICLETENSLTFDPYRISEMLRKNKYQKLVQKLPPVVSKLGNKSVEYYYNDSFKLYPKKLTFQTIQTTILGKMFGTK